MQDTNAGQPRRALTNSRILGGLWGAIVGDALGVPVEFQSRNSLRQRPVTEMRGEGTHGQLPGTWSDDSSLLLCTAEALLSGFDTGRMADGFVRWLGENHWTPRGEVFDVGITTRRAIDNLRRGVEPEEAGLDEEHSNGNGSLMRILPVALRFADSPRDQLTAYAHRASALTHRHPRSQVACGLYCLMAAALLSGAGPHEAHEAMADLGRRLYADSPLEAELPHFVRLLSGELHALDEEVISSSGYVVHTLEASVWCLLRTRSFEEAVLLAVNLGEDTDTTGIVTGGLAGLHYGLEAVPDAWRTALARHEELGPFFDTFVASCLAAESGEHPASPQG
jgi:ADP-ribosylglycohydrolase